MVFIMRLPGHSSLRLMAFLRRVGHRKRPIENRPQDEILPHNPLAGLPDPHWPSHIVVLWVAAPGRVVAASGLGSPAGLPGDGLAAAALTLVVLCNKSAPGGLRFARVCPAGAWRNRWRREFRDRCSARDVRCGPVST